MSLPAGATLGPYEILALIGQGGMGEVYLARDPRLKRDVAVKVSREQFGQRFEREARVVASLNHPNICHLYDVGPNYLVMELVEGRTLAERMREKPLMEADVFHIASQIAEALAAAHEKGIVHRDLKPANVKIRPDGTVKVLDFGLARAAGAAPATDDSPTGSMDLTQAGAVLGTAAYMAPEQAKGLTVDKRADVWSFGVVLYEMLSGERLFRGSTLTETLAAVIEREPDMSRVPAKARPLLRRCLAKDPRKRLHDIADAMPMLELVPVPEEAAPARGGTFRVLPWVIAAAALAAAGATTFLYLREQAAAVPPALVRFRIPVPENEKPGNFALSPDGAQLAFIASGPDTPTHLWVRKLDSLEAHQLPDTEGASGRPFWSPDSRFIVFAADRKLKKIESFGGPPQSLCDLFTISYGGAWGPDNVILLGTPRGIEQVSANGGTLALVAVGRMNLGSGSPALLPDGRHFLYFNADVAPSQRGVWAGSLDARPEDQPRNRLFATPANFAYLHSPAGIGRVVYLRDGSLVTQVLDEDRLELKGEAVPLVDRVAENNGYGFFTVSHSEVVYRPVAGEDVSRLTSYDREGSLLSAAGESGAYDSAVVSPDGKLAAVTQAGDVWIVDLARGTSTRLTASRTVLGEPVWSPDESHVAYAANPGGTVGLYQKAVNGAGGEELLWKADFGGVLGPSDWSHDRRFLLFGVVTPRTSFEIWALPLQGDRKPFPVLQTEFSAGRARLSPDGRWIAYLSNKSRKSEIYVQPFDPDKKVSGEEKLVSKGGAVDLPRWRIDQKELYYLAPGGKFMAVEVGAGTEFRGAPTVVFQTPPSFATWKLPNPVADVSSDGKRFLLAMPVAHSPAGDGFIVVLNWQSLLAK